MPFADLPNVRLHYSFAGPAAAPALLLSHSLGTTLSMWDAQMSIFEQSFRVLRYDMRGHGKSSVPPPPYSVNDLAQDVLAFADSLNLRRFHCPLRRQAITAPTRVRPAHERVESARLISAASTI